MTTPHAPCPLVFERIPLGRHASQPFSLEVPAHHTVAVLGDEDSGVGFLGSYALGLDRPAAGRALAFDTDIAALDEAERLAFRRRVGYLPAGEGLLQNLSLRDNVALPLRFGSGASPQEIEGRVNVMLTVVRVAAVGQLRPAQANEEERRRAALARAIAFDPTLLVLEQPFDGLTARVASELLELARGGGVGGRGAPHDLHHRPGDPVAAAAAGGAGVPAHARRPARARNRLTRGRVETRQDFYVGLLIVVTIAVVVGALIATSGWGERRYDVYLRVANAEGISPDTKALVQGLEVGRVRSISPTVDSISGTISFVARLSVAEKFADGSSLRLPRGTRAEVDASTPLAPAHINLLLPDTVGARRLFVEPGDTIRMSRRGSAMEKMAEVADVLSQRVQEMVRQATQTLARVQSTIRDVAPNIESTLSSVATAMGRVDSLVERLHRAGLSDSIAATVAGTNRLLVRLDSLARDASALTSENRADLRATVVNLTEASRQLNHFVDQMSRRPYRALTGVKPLPRDSTGAKP